MVGGYESGPQNLSENQPPDTIHTDFYRVLGARKNEPLINEIHPGWLIWLKRDDHAKIPWTFPTQTDKQVRERM